MPPDPISPGSSEDWLLVEKDRYLLELCRYVVLNPVRAGMVRSAREYRWSSYRATAGLRVTPELLCTD